MEQILEDVIQIMQQDYAGCRDKKDWDRPDYFRQKLKKLQVEERLNPYTFIELVKEYLADFGDHHTYFTGESQEASLKATPGFLVRRFENRLYVLEVLGEERIKKGDAIITIDGQSLDEQKKRHSHLLDENHPERENWDAVLRLSTEIGIEEDNGKVSPLILKSFPKKPYQPVYKVEELNEQTLLIVMTDFANPDAIAEMVSENRSLLESGRNWIIDVRVNYGGSDSSYHPLLPYLVPLEGMDLADTDERMLINCTENNAALVLQEINSELQNTADPGAKQFLEVFKREWKNNAGKGFVEFNFSDIVPDTYIEGLRGPEQIIVLADHKCGSSGDSFVELCRKSNRVKVIGRATMGLNDYANLAIKKWAHGFELGYPTSRLSRVDKGQGMTGVGILPEMYIPWTPEHIHEDPDLLKAVELLTVPEIEAVENHKDALDHSDSQ